ncbi:homoserine O-succinyltransferase [Fructilactobacillus vespulae]|uniref:homoserine O-acetyltransferase/O-succinyltransferase family protein n=1 Tax=Fructilactobacillus vespulae TaxID=1249630 RepID=UPI0039B3EFD4
MGCMNILSGYAKNRRTTTKNAINLVVFNLMPNRAETEHQIISLLKRTPHDFNLTFCRMKTHRCKHFAKDVAKRYLTLADINNQHFDALIVTGAPVDQKPFQEVDYFTEFKELLQWRKTHVKTCLFSCWAAWAAGTVDQVLTGHPHKQKIYGIYTTDGFTMPHSRYFTIPVNQVTGEVIAGDPEIGATLIHSDKTASYYVTGHLEYGTNTLADEFYRDVSKGLHPHKPLNYFDQKQHPHNTWNQTATKFYRQWLSQFKKAA